MIILISELIAIMNLSNYPTVVFQLRNKEHKCFYSYSSKTLWLAAMVITKLLLMYYAFFINAPDSNS